MTYTNKILLSVLLTECTKEMKDLKLWKPRQKSDVFNKENKAKSMGKKK